MAGGSNDGCSARTPVSRTRVVRVLDGAVSAPARRSGERVHALSNTSHVFVHRVDAFDTVTDVNDRWLEFARENGAENLTADSVVGQSLWRYVVGADVLHIYRQLFKEVRSGRNITLPFRCDSPTVKRYHQMRIIGLDSGAIECESRLLRQEIQDPGPVTALDPTVQHSDRVVLMCSWCKQVQDPVGNWLPLERAVWVMQLLATTQPPAITHGICPSCQAKVTSN